MARNSFAKSDILYIKIGFDAEKVVAFNEAMKNVHQIMADLNDAAVELQKAMYELGNSLELQKDTKPAEVADDDKQNEMHFCVACRTLRYPTKRNRCPECGTLLYGLD